MSLTVKGLFDAQTVTLGELQLYTAAQLESVDTVIRNQSDIGLCHVTYALPTSHAKFPTNLFRVFVYGTLVESLKKRGFTVKIATSKNVMHISWPGNIGIEPDEIKRLADLVRIHTS